jgi:hypothetical protein
MKRFINPLDPENHQIKAALRLWLIERLKLDADAVVQILEQTCTEPSCVYAETVIVIENTGHRASAESGKEVQFYKITKPLVYIRKGDLDRLERIEKVESHRH